MILVASPEECVNLLNGDLSVLARKKFPKGYVGWVYIYCTKEKPYLYRVDDDNHFEITNKLKPHTEEYVKDYNALNGKVVARFWVDKVEDTFNFYDEELCQLACINKEELCKYAGSWFKTDDLLAIHIIKLEIFDKPREISEFSSKIEKTCICFNQFVAEGTRKIPLTRAPQSWCYIEV